MCDLNIFSQSVDKLFSRINVCWEVNYANYDEVQFIKVLF